MGKLVRGGTSRAQVVVQKTEGHVAHGRREQIKVLLPTSVLTADVTNVCRSTFFPPPQAMADNSCHQFCLRVHPFSQVEFSLPYFDVIGRSKT